MATLGSVQNRVLDQIDRDDLTAQVALAIADAIEHYKTERWTFNQKRATAVLQPNKNRIAIPDDLVELDQLSLRINGRPYLLRNITWRRFTELELSSEDTGDPQQFVTYRQQFHFDRYADATRTLELSYVYDLGIPGENASNAWTEEGQNLIRSRAAMLVASHTLHDSELATALRAEEDEAYFSLKRLATIQLTTGRTKVHRW